MTTEKDERAAIQAVLDVADTLELQGETSVSIERVMILVKPLRAAIANAAGTVMVPREPTPEMRNAAIEAITALALYHDGPGHIYRAMLAAAYPEVPK